MGELYTIAAAVMLVYMVSLYIYSSIILDASIIDIAWGFGFVILAIGLTFYFPEHSRLKYIVAALVSVWGIRLSLHIGTRRIGKPEDWRYAQWRKSWGRTYHVRSLLQIFLLQGLLIMVVALPVVVASNQRSDSGLTSIQLIGALVFVFGLAFETISDWQLTKFLRTRKPKQVMQHGLWKYSRHPNYFGEVTLWWGLWLMVLPLPYGLAAIVSPLTITFLILFVSGVPMLEKKYKSNSGFKAYAKKTSIFIPLPPKKS